MSFKLSPIVELPSNSNCTIPDAELEKVVHFAQIVEDNFLLVLLLTSRGSLVIHYSTGYSSRLESIPISRLFPHHKLASLPVVVALTEDASVVVLLLSDCNTILLIPFISLMDVTWGRPSTLLVTKPIFFCLQNPTIAPNSFDENHYEEKQVQMESGISNCKPSAALCFYSRLAQRTYLLFGNKAGSLFLVDLHLKRVSIRIDLCAGIRSMHVHISRQDGQKQLLITQYDDIQLILPIENNQLPIRETLARINPTDVHCLNEQLHLFPQSNVGQNTALVCVLDKRDHSLKVIQTLNSISLATQTNSEQVLVQLNGIPTNIRQVLFGHHTVVLLFTAQNRILIHHCFLQSSPNKADFVPITFEPSNNTLLGLISTDKLASNSLLPAADMELDEEVQKQNVTDQILNICLMVTDRGLYWLEPEKSMFGIILDHLSAHMFCTDVFTPVAQCLQTTIGSLCLSLLRSLLQPDGSNKISIIDSANDAKLTAQVDGLLSLAFVNNIQPNLLLSMLQSCGQAELLLPFLTMKCERNPEDTALRKLVFDAMLARLTRLLSQQQEINTPEESEQMSFNTRQEKLKRLASDIDILEYEIRHFLIKFDICESDVLPLLLRNLLWSSVCVLLSRNPKEHSVTVARFLLELPSWKSVHRIGALLRCIGFLHWDDLDSYAPTLAVKLFNLVPSLDINQLRTVDTVADSLIARSIESALSLKLIISMRIFGLTMDLHKSSKLATDVKNLQQTVPASNCKLHFLLACGSNCSLVLAEDDIASTNELIPTEISKELDAKAERRETNETTLKTANKSAMARHQPMFWGEFLAGTTRILRDNQQPTMTATSAKAATDSQTVGKKIEILKPSSPAKTKQQQQQTSKLNSRRQQHQLRETMRKQQENKFPLVPVPRLVQLPTASVEICSVACGTEHALLLASDGRIYAWGQNRFGQCGTGNCLPVAATTEIKWGEWKRPIGVFAGHYHSALLTEDNEIWIWGWAVHGQLGIGCIEDKHAPIKCVPFNKLGPIKSISLAYAHTLVLYADGRVFGCGAMAHGQLGIDPTQYVRNLQKIHLPIQLQFPTPILLLSSAFFHGLALAENGQDIFEWGECPQSLKMRMFLQKRLRAKEKQQTKNDDTTKTELPEKAGESTTRKQEKQEAKMTVQKNSEQTVTESKCVASLPPQTPIEMPREHFRIRRLCEWKGAPVKALSAGFNHSALLTVDGDMYTWGKSLEMQLGHGNRKERMQPTRLEPQEQLAGVKWSNVICSRNFTVAFSIDGLVYVWGRNDRNQLGIGSVQSIKQQQPIRRILLRTEKSKTQRAVELPADNCVERPTMLAGLRVQLHDEAKQVPSESKIFYLLASADQHSISFVSRFLSRHPIPAFVAVQAHLMAGDLLAGLRLLTIIAQREQLLGKQQEEAHCIKKKAQKSETEQHGSAVEHQQEQKKITLINRVVCLDNVDGRNNNKTQQKTTMAQTTLRKTPSQSRIGTLKMSSNNNTGFSTTIFGNQAHSIPPPTPRRVAVQLRTTRAPAATTTGNESNKSSPISPNDALLAMEIDDDINSNNSLPTSSIANRSENTETTLSYELQQQQQRTFSSATDDNATEQNARLEQFHVLVDRLWALLRVHPLREVQTVALVQLLHARFPIYNRLAADVRLCRLAEPFLPPLASALESSSGITTRTTTTSLPSASYMVQRKFMDLAVRERQATLRAMPPPDTESRRFCALRTRCEQMLAQDRLRYFADCGHFEKCVVESGPMRSEQAAMRNRMRRCTRCLHSRRSSGSVGGITEQQHQQQQSQAHSAPAHHKSTS